MSYVYCSFCVFFFFFFSSRRRHTRFDCDWSSDVCSSDLRDDDRALQPAHQSGRPPGRRGTSAGVARQGRAPERHGPLALQEGRSAGETARLVGRLRKPHGQQGEVSVFPLVENPGAVFVPHARLYVVNEERQVVAGPLIVARRRAYHREWLLGVVGVTARAVVESWRGALLPRGEGPSRA